MDKKKSLRIKYSSKDDSMSYKLKYENLEEKYSRIKDILKQVLKDLKEEKENVQLLKKQYDKLRKEVKEKDDLLERLQSVSEAVVDEYSTLKTKYELETEAANSALKRATKYFQENQLLKKNTIVLQDPSNILEPESTDTAKDSDESISEIEVLHKVTSELRSEVASLKTQMHRESEKQKSLKEDFEIAKKLYEEEMIEHNATKEKLQLLITAKEEQLSAKSEAHDPGENTEISGASNERKFSEEVFEYFDMSQLNDKLSEANRKIEELSNLEETVWQQRLQIEELENKLKSIDENKVAMIDSEGATKSLEFAEQQLYTCERKNATLEHKIQELECQIQRLKAGILPMNIAPPPPPPPPPPSFNPIKSLMTFINAGKKSSRHSPKKEAVAGANNHQKMMTEMIDAIKKGNIHLKPTPKAVPVSCGKDSEDSAVGEMQSILSAIKHKTASHSPSDLERSDEFLCDAKELHSRKQPLFSNAHLDEELQVIFRKKSLVSLPSTDNSSISTQADHDKMQDSNESLSSLTIGKATDKDTIQGLTTRSLFVANTSHMISDVKENVRNSV